jgi:hypothetical protein
MLIKLKQLFGYKPVNLAEAINTHVFIMIRYEPSKIQKIPYAIESKVLLGLRINTFFPLYLKNTYVR